MFNDRRPPAGEHADAYRASEPTRQRDPFAASTLQVALASETERRTRRQGSSRLGQLVDQDRDEDDVVDAQHQLERGQRGKSDPGLGVSEQFDDAGLVGCSGPQAAAEISDGADFG